MAVTDWLSLWSAELTVWPDTEAWRGGVLLVRVRMGVCRRRCCVGKFALRQYSARRAGRAVDIAMVCLYFFVFWENGSYVGNNGGV